MSEFSSKLKRLGGNWKKASKRDASAFGGSTLEDGIYRMRITGAELTESQSSGRLQIAWEFTVADGDSKGEVVRDYDGLESEDNLFFLQRKLARLEKEVPEDISLIEKVLAEIIKEKPLIRAKVKTKEDFTHVYINRLLNDAGEDKEAPEGEETTEEDAEAEAEAEPEEVTAEAEGAAPEAEGEPEPEAETKEVSLQEGMKVSFTQGGKSVEGEILGFVDNDTKARVKSAAGVFRVATDQLTPVAGEEAPEPEAEPEPEPAPAKKGPGRPPKTAGAVSKVKAKK